jgi:hypothetical protein
MNTTCITGKDITISTCAVYINNVSCVAASNDTAFQSNVDDN